MARFELATSLVTLNDFANAPWGSVSKREGYVSQRKSIADGAAPQIGTGLRQHAVFNPSRDFEDLIDFIWQERILRGDANYSQITRRPFRNEGADLRQP
jgi:hypothetical protein